MPYSDLRKGRFSEPGREYFITATLHQRRPLFRDFSLARLAIVELRRLEQENCVTWLAWVLMPDHLHGLARIGNEDLSATIKKLKGRSGRRINRATNQRGTVWQPGFHDHALRKEEDRLAIARYIVANPLRAGLVSRLGDYPHWDSVWLD
ncbi:MAG TPA: transposase [Chromatiaceae bacterium]|nr:transposase [Chromatiaceae bacterium]